MRQHIKYILCTVAVVCLIVFAGSIPKRNSLQASGISVGCVPPNTFSDNAALYDGENGTCQDMRSTFYNPATGQVTINSGYAGNATNFFTNSMAVVGDTEDATVGLVRLGNSCNGGTGGGGLVIGWRNNGNTGNETLGISGGTCESLQFSGGDIQASGNGSGTLSFMSGSTGVFPTQTGHVLLRAVNGDLLCWENSFSTGPACYAMSEFGSLTGQSASAGPFMVHNSAGQNYGAGMFRLTYDLVLIAAGTAGTATLTFTWTNDGGAQTFTTGALALNGTPGQEVSGTLPFWDAGTVIPTWSTTVAGKMGTPTFNARIRVEYLN